MFRFFSAIFFRNVRVDPRNEENIVMIVIGTAVQRAARINVGPRFPSECEQGNFCD